MNTDQSLRQGSCQRRNLVERLTQVTFVGWLLMVTTPGWIQGQPKEIATPELSIVEMATVMQQLTVEAIARAEKSVVALVRVRKGSRSSVRVEDDDLLGFFPPRLPQQNEDPQDPDFAERHFIPSEFATGVVIDSEGLILTAYHVLGNPEKYDYYVWLNHRPFKVVEKVVAADPWTDLAVLKIDAADLVPISFGDAQQLKKGMFVVALGNPYAIARDGEVSASWGIIANLSRKAALTQNLENLTLEKQTLHHYGTLIQTDAKLNLGTSGGALVNLKGEMIGLTISIAALQGYESAVGFAIPVNDVFRRVVETLKDGRVPTFGFLGVGPENRQISERRRGKFGARVVTVVPGTPAQEAQLQLGDIITSVAGVRIYDKNDLFRELSKRKAGGSIQLTVERRNRGNLQNSLTQSVRLSKKYIETVMSEHGTQHEDSWRGLQVEYATAMAPKTLQSLIQGMQRGLQEQAMELPVGILSVAKDSLAWKAGFRPGEFVSHVAGEPVSTPQNFHQKVAELEGEVRLRTVTASGRSSVRILAAP